MKSVILLLVVLLCGCGKPALNIPLTDGEHPKIYYEANTNVYFLHYTIKPDVMLSCKRCHPQFKGIQSNGDRYYPIHFNIETVTPE